MIETIKNSSCGTQFIIYNFHWRYEPAIANFSSIYDSFCSRFICSFSLQLINTRLLQCNDTRMWGRAPAVTAFFNLCTCRVVELQLLWFVNSIFNSIDAGKNHTGIRSLQWAGEMETWFWKIRLRWSPPPPSRQNCSVCILKCREQSNKQLTRGGAIETSYLVE